MGSRRGQRALTMSAVDLGAGNAARLVHNLAPFAKSLEGGGANSRKQLG